MESAGMYERLAAPFEQTFTDTRGGVELTYVTGEQVIRRLNEVLGVAGWNFSVREHGINDQADEVWVLGDLTVTLGGATILKSQFGSQKLKRKRQPNADGLREILDIGFDLKGAATDALKKCATLVGVGLYLSRKEEMSHSEQPQQQTTQPVRAQQNGVAQSPPNAAGLTCQECGNALQETKFGDGTVWTPADLAGHGRRKYGRVLCMGDYRKAKAAAASAPPAQPADAEAF